jgi:DNA (cytosine-5)-methyltransferase 1
MGYHRAGFDVVGVDINPQPNYPFEFHQADALTYPLDGYDAIHASPPCQRYSTATGRARKQTHDPDAYPDLIAPTRARLVEFSGVPWVMENVEAAPLVNHVRLCGSTFGLDLRRHRLFELGRWHPVLVPPCAHHWQTPRFRSLDGARGRAGYLARVIGVHGHTNYAGERALRERSMGIDWMTPSELVEAIPPAYTEFIGGQLLDHLGRVLSLTAPGAFRPRLGVVNRGARSHDFAVTRADTPTP